MRPWIMPTLAGVLALALAATGTFAVVQSERAADQRQRAEELDDELAQLRDELQATQDELDAARAEQRSDEQDDDERGAGDDADAEGSGLDVGGMLDDLLGGDIPGEECFVPDADDDLEGLLDGLFGGGSLPEDPDELVTTIADQLTELRELEWQEPVDAEFVTTPELEERLETLLDEDLDPAEVEADERLLSTLGAIPEDADLEALQRDLLDDQVAGYYVPETGELVVRVPDDERLRPTDAVTLAHELDHALTDQALGLPDRAEPPFAGDDDATLAVLSVIEGDASLLMNLWALGELSIGDQLAMAMDPSIAAAQSSLDDVPHYLQRELLSPYTDGLEWACQVYLDGGWTAVDAAYDDPPSTTAEVLWGEPVEPATTATVAPPEGFEELERTTLGAAQLKWLLEAPGGDPAAALDEPDGRARAWAGGEVAVWARDDDSAVGVALVDDGTGTAPLCDTVEAWYRAAFPDATAAGQARTTTFTGEDASAALRCEADDVLLGIAPDTGAASSIVGG